MAGRVTEHRVTLNRKPRKRLEALVPKLRSRVRLFRDQQRAHWTPMARTFAHAPRCNCDPCSRPP